MSKSENPLTVMQIIRACVGYIDAGDEPGEVADRLLTAIEAQGWDFVRRRDEPEPSPPTVPGITGHKWNWDEASVGVQEKYHARAKEMARVVFLKEVDAGTPNACWVVCAKGDPGAVGFAPL